MHNFKDKSYLQNGNSIQKDTYQSLEELNLFEILKSFTPVLAGTIPININIENSDLDIICYCKNLDEFRISVIESFGQMNDFKINKKTIRNQETVVARFYFNNFLFEIFGQNQPIEKQEAYRHMLIEHCVIQEKGESFRKQIISLKRQGFKTEPAFAKLLNLKGDPYLELLKFGESFS